jgi:hypothetical protein
MMAEQLWRVCRREPPHQGHGCWGVPAVDGGWRFAVPVAAPALLIEDGREAFIERGQAALNGALSDLGASAVLSFEAIFDAAVGEG